jgi:hypothetical protein
MSDNPFAAPVSDPAPGPSPMDASFQAPAGGVIIGLIATILVDLLAGLAVLLVPDDQKDVTIGFGALGELFLLIVCGILWGLWSVRAAKNARVLSDRVFEYSPGSTVWWFFVPFLNLVRPYQALKEIDAASEPEGASVGDAILGVWWALWIISRIISRIGADVPAMGLIWFALDGAAAFAAIAVVRRINANQVKKHGQREGRAIAA